MPDFNTAFTDVLAALNPEQKAAVRHIDGPVLVVAGPGTGKTHILSARIGQILTETDTAPYNILCLTFTEAGVQAMRERLLTLIGPAAHKVSIFTFHAFCNKVIHDNLDLFGRQELSPLDELERHDLLRHLLDELDYAHPLKRQANDPYFYEKHLADLFRIMKTEAWTAEFVVKKIDEYLQTLPTNPEFIYQNTRKGMWEKGDLKTEKIAETSLKMERLRAAALLYGRYAALLRGGYRYDFDDMVLWVIEAFDKFPFLLRQYQEQYLYFLVDEYQDTNGSQNKILAQLIGFWENPNIFIVGDDDQAIYEFQGARLKSLLEFYDVYKNHVEVILLKNNYRSSQTLLDVAKSLIDINTLRITRQLTDLNIDKNLVAFKKEKQKVHIREYPNRLHELTGIINHLTQLSKTTPLSKIAIIYARHREAEPLIALLEKNNIPYQTKRRLNILDTPIIQNLRLLLEYIALESNNPFSGEHLLFKVLNINFLNINTADILSVAHYMAHRYNPPDTDDDDNPPPPPRLLWRHILNHPPAKTVKQLDAWKNVAQFIETNIRDCHNKPLLVLIESIINKSGLLRWVKTDTDGIWSLQIVHTFFEFVRTEVDKKPRLTLGGLLTTLDILDKNHIAIEFIQNIENTEGVVLTTAHSAKGLEFDTVFIMDTVETEWESAKSSGGQRFTLPDTLTYTAEEDATEARRRLMYVAMTRAQRQLFISYSKADEKGKALRRSLFVDEILSSVDSRLLQFEKITLSDAHIIDNQMTKLTEIEPPDVTLFDKHFIRAALKDFSLSVSALNVYLECPLSFYFTFILKIPSAASEAALYGTAAHNALRRLFGDMLKDKDRQFPSVEAFITYFEGEMQSLRSQFYSTDFHRRLANGRKYLQAFYQYHIADWDKNVVVERAVVAESDGVPLRGVLDKIVFKNDGTIHVVDYKTGKPDDSRTRRPTAKNPLGGAYWRQLVFYKILYENARSNLLRVKTGEITYLEPDNKGHFKSKIIDIEAKDVEQLRGVIKEVWSNIKAQQFSGCGKTTCEWCQFFKNNRLPHVFSKAIVEELDE